MSRLWSDVKPVAAKAARAANAPIEGATALKVLLHGRLLEILNLSVRDRTPREALRLEIRGAVVQLLAEEKRLLTPRQTDQLIDDLLDEILGLGPLEPLLKDDTISDIRINTHETVYVERRGRLERTDVQFQDTRHLVRIINKIVAAVGRRVDESSPMVDARLADGSRVNAIIPPLSVDGPLVSIRKFARIPIGIEMLIELGSMTEDMAKMLEAIVQGRRNVLISGGTGSGKTTLLNALSSFISDRERILTIEDSAELQLQQPHVGRLETRPANIEGKGEVAQRELVKNALRMRPDRIIVGEVRAGEAFDMLQAMNTGHDGSMSTIHSNSARDALSRLETMVMMASIDLPYEAVRAQIGSAINMLVHQARMPDGRRKIVQVAEVLGYNADGPVLRDIYVLGMGADLHLEYNATGYVPRLLDKAAFYGVQVPDRLFDPEFARYIPAGADSMMPVIKDPLLESDPYRRPGGDIIREVVVVPFSSTQTTYATAAETAEEEREARRESSLSRDRGQSQYDPMELGRRAQTMMPASAGLSEDVRDLITAAREAVGGPRPAAAPAAGGGGAAGVAPASSEPVFIPQWQAPRGGGNVRATAGNAKRRVKAVIETLVAYLGLNRRLAETINSAFNGSEVKIGDYAREARISSTTASRDLNRAATAGLRVAQKQPQLGVTYRAGSFLMQAVAYGLGLNFGDAEALNADSIVSKVLDSLRVTR